MRLGTALILLSESGFVHRMHWNQEFHCSKDQRDGESISEELAIASTAMEICYVNWKKKVSDARSEYQELNFFTTQQLMLLRKEIAIACRRSDLLVDNLQVLTLLESVCANLDTKLLTAAILRAFKDTNLLDQIKRMEDLPSLSLLPHQQECDTSTSLFGKNNYVDRIPSTGVTSPEFQNTSSKKQQPKDVSKIRRFLDAAEGDGYSEQVALSALARLGIDAEEDDLLLWCLEESDDADLESLYAEAMGNPSIVRVIYSQEVSDVQEIHREEKRYHNSVAVIYIPVILLPRIIVYPTTKTGRNSISTQTSLNRLQQLPAPYERLGQTVQSQLHHNIAMTIDEPKRTFYVSVHFIINL